MCRFHRNHAKQVEYKNMTIDSVKPYAEELVICIDTAVDGEDDLDDEGVASMAALGMMTMGWME